MKYVLPQSEKLDITFLIAFKASGHNEFLLK